MLELLAVQPSWSDHISFIVPFSSFIAPFFFVIPYAVSHSSLIFSVTQHCDYGCILAVLSSGEEKFACAGLPLKLDPDSDGIYRVKIYSGFPLFHNDDEFTTPLYDQGYVWSENYERVTVDRNNCLKIVREFRSPSSPSPFFFVFLGAPLFSILESNPVKTMHSGCYLFWCWMALVDARLQTIIREESRIPIGFMLTLTAERFQTGQSTSPTQVP